MQFDGGWFELNKVNHSMMAGGADNYVVLVVSRRKLSLGMVGVVQGVVIN